MKLKTRVFELYKGKYRSLYELARVMGISLGYICKGSRASPKSSSLGQQRRFQDIGLMTFSMLPQGEARMTANNENDFSKMLRQRRLMIPLTLYELAAKSGVSASHLGHIERAKLPLSLCSTKVTKPLSCDEDELFMLAGFLSQRFPTLGEQVSPSYLN